MSMPITKKALILRLISRKRGASINELVEATGWKNNSLLGALSTMRHKGGVKIDRSTHLKRGTVYHAET